MLGWNEEITVVGLDLFRKHGKGYIDKWSIMYGKVYKRVIQIKVDDPIIAGWWFVFLKISPKKGILFWEDGKLSA